MKSLIQISCLATLLAFGIALGDDYAFNPAHDTWVDQVNPGTNYGTTTNAHIKSLANSNEYALLKFDISSITGVVTGASIRFMVNYCAADSARMCRLYNLSGAWTESNATWNSGNWAVGSAICDFNINSDIGFEWVELDVSQAVKDAQGAGTAFAACIENISGGGNSRWEIKTKESTNLPVLLVKTAIDLSPIADVRIVENTPNTNYAAGTALIIRNDPYNLNHNESYVKFALPSGFLINWKSAASVKLMLWCQYYGASSPLDSITNVVYKVANDSWDEASLTWNNRPYSTDTLLPTAGSKVTGTGWVSIDVTQAVLDESAGNDTVTFVMANTTIGEDNTEIRFNSYDNASVNKPRLRVVYNTLRSPAKDAKVMSGAYATTNYGTNYDLWSQYVTADGSGNANSQIYMQFNVQNVVGQVLNASLYVFKHFSGSDSVFDAGVSRVGDDSWSETGITWNNKPTPDAGVTGAFNYVDKDPAFGVWLPINITDLVQRESLGDGALSLCLKGMTLSNNNLLKFYSKEWSDPWYAPFLSIRTKSLDY
jgi:hypothetical protein